MRALIMLALALNLAVAAAAQDIGHKGPVKQPQSYPENIPDPDRQAGDTIATATLIPALPYSDSGTTVGYVDDYDEVCPYSGGTAPDVVYKFVCPFTGAIDIDLCGSSFDTKLYVYDAGLNLIACNDDYYTGPPCGTYVSLLENVQLIAGTTYYFIVDGYGNASGSYQFDIKSCGKCACYVVCPDGGQLEGEPPLADNYVDNWNGGCNTAPAYPFGPVAGDADGEAILCGVSGWYHFGGNDYRDTDWYILVMGTNGVIEIESQSEFATNIFELGPQDCATVGVLQQATGDDCEPLARLTVSGYASGTPVWFWIGPTVYAAPGGGVAEFDYVVWFSGLDPRSRRRRRPGPRSRRLRLTGGKRPCAIWFSLSSVWF